MMLFGVMICLLGGSAVELATKYQLPLFLHSRTSEAHTDFVRIIRTHEARHPAAKILPARRKGVVHSFTGSLDEMNELVGLGFCIGINGWSVAFRLAACFFPHLNRNDPKRSAVDRYPGHLKDHL
jgi:hypothetical protein